MACNLSFVVKKMKEFLKVTCSHIYFKSGSILKLVLDRNVVTTGH